MSMFLVTYLSSRKYRLKERVADCLSYLWKTLPSRKGPVPSFQPPASAACSLSRFSSLVWGNDMWQRQRPCDSDNDWGIWWYKKFKEKCQHFLIKKKIVTTMLPARRRQGLSFLKGEILQWLLEGGGRWVCLYEKNKDINTYLYI